MEEKGRSIVVDKKDVGSSFRPKRIPASQKLPTIISLKLTETFNAIYRRGRWVRGRDLSLGVLQRPQEDVIRIGLRTKRGLKGAVVRNRLKRQIRALIYDQRLPLRSGIDVVIVIHPPEGRADQSALKTELVQLCQRANILERQRSSS